MFNAIFWHFQIFSGTNVGIMIFLHLFTGYVLSYYHHVRLKNLDTQIVSWIVLFIPLTASPVPLASCINIDVFLAHFGNIGIGALEIDHGGCMHFHPHIPTLILCLWHKVATGSLALFCI